MTSPVPTGQPDGPMVCGQAAADRLMESIRQRHQPFLDGLRPSEEQVVLVLRALADHTLILAALDYRPEPPPSFAEQFAEAVATSPRTQHAASLARFLHDTADQLTDRRTL